MRLQTRHWAFAGLFVLIAVVMASGIKLSVPVSPETQKMHDFIDSLPPGAVLLVSFDHEASSLPEIRPLARALLRHCFERGLRPVGLALLAEGTAIGYRLMQTTAREYGKEYGTDYAYLGFKPQYVAAILSMGESISTTFPQDYLGRPYNSLAMLRGIETYDDVAAVLSIADGSFTTHWMEYGGRYGVPVIAGVTAAMVTTYDPYLASGQMQAMVGGLRGAAEYEKLLGRKGGGGARGMLAQSAAHLYVILLIILGNVSYFIKRRRSA